jgi:protein PhnA
MMETEKSALCPQCKSPYAYAMDHLMVCPDCGHEWNTADSANAIESENDSLLVKDAHGNLLQNGDSVTIIKDLPVKGAAKAIKVGTKVSNIKLVAGDHNIDCKIPGFGAMALKSEFVKKLN